MLQNEGRRMTDWSDPRRKVLELQAELKRLKARAERVGAPATAAALDEAIARSERDVDQLSAPT